MEGRCVTADGTSEPSEKSKKQQADGQALMSGTMSDKVELQTDGIEFTDGIGTGEVNREAKVVDGPGAGGFPFFAARLEDFRVKEVLEVAGRMARDTELQEDGESLTKKPAEKKARWAGRQAAGRGMVRVLAILCLCVRVFVLCIGEFDMCLVQQACFSSSDLLYQIDKLNYTMYKLEYNVVKQQFRIVCGIPRRKHASPSK